MSPAGRIKESDIEAIRERTDIVKLISEYVPLKKSGREFRGPCPFHQEKDPSFYVNPAKGVYFCFGCKASGGLFNFVMQMEGLSFSESVEHLADRIGYQITYEAASSADIKDRLERDRLFKLNQTASDFYHYMLSESEAGEVARGYLSQRGFDGDIAEEFHLGFAPPGWDNLCTFLTKKGFKGQELARVGIARQRSGGSGSGFYDVFRNRVIFPIYDHRGRVVAFGGRRMPGSEDDREPKYLNSPETPIYRKGHTLYGFHQTRPFVQDSREVVVVEGYTDLLALWMAGIKGVVASLGTALTVNHFELLGRFCDRVYLAFDADRAGIDAARRTLEFFNRFRMDVFVVSLPEGQDPANLVEKGGKDAFLELKGESESLLDFSARKTIEGYDIGNAWGRRKAMEACLPIFSKVMGESYRPVRDDLVRKVAGILDMPRETVEFYLREASRAQSGPSTRRLESRATVMWNKVEKEALRLLLHSPEAFLEHQYLDEDFFFEEDNKKILAILKEIPVDDEERILADYGSIVSRAVEGIQDGELRGKLIQLLMESPPECNPGYEDRVFDRLECMFFKRQKRKLEQEIGRVNKKIEPKKYEALCDRVLEIDRLLKELFPYDHD